MAYIPKYFCGAIVISAALALTGCKSVKHMEGEVIRLDSLNEVFNIELSNKDYIDSYSVIKLSSTDKLMHHIDQIQIFEDRIYILDRQPKRLLVFDINGEYLHDIGRFGRGEGEFTVNSAFYINPEDKIVNIIDPMVNAILRYDLNGSFIEKKTLDKAVKSETIESMRYMGDNKVACYSNPNVFDDKMMFILDENSLAIIDVISTSPFKPDIGAYVYATQPYSIISGELHFVSPFETGINVYAKGKSKRLFSIDEGIPEMDDKTLETFAANSEYNYFTAALNIIKDGEYSVGLQNYFESDRFIFCNFMFGQSLIWDKQSKTGEVIDLPRDHIPGLNCIGYGEGNIFVKIWDSPQIERFKSEVDNGNLTPDDYDQAVIDIVNGYDVDQDNPVLFIFRMKN